MENITEILNLIIDDAIKCIYKLLKLNEFHKVDRKRNKFFQIFHLGGGKKIKITQLIRSLEKFLNKKAKTNLGPLKKGDIVSSQSDIRKLKRNINYSPNTPFEQGLKNLLNGLLTKIKNYIILSNLFFRLFFLSLYELQMIIYLNQ